VVGGAVPVVNLPDIRSGDLTLDGDTLAKIYMGEITKWDDAAITKLNPTLALPNTDIVVVHRSDGSGTTFIWTNYLSKVSKAWSDKIGAGTAVEWPVGLGAKGNEGVAGNVQQTAGSIGYVELAYATANKLSYTAMINKDGNKVQPSIDSFAAAAGNADWANAKDFYLILTDQPGENAWPVAGATFILIYKDPSDKVATKQALDFFKWAYENGNDMARDLDYVPLPDNVHKFIEATWDKTINLN
jgi:phosphate transport system substrate-binding protein